MGEHSSLRLVNLDMVKSNPHRGQKEPGIWCLCNIQAVMANLRFGKLPLIFSLCSSSSLLFSLFFFFFLADSRQNSNNDSLPTVALWLYLLPEVLFSSDNQISKGLKYVGLFLREIWPFIGLTALNLWPSWDRAIVAWGTQSSWSHACSLQKAGKSHTFCVLLLCVKIKSLCWLEPLYLWPHDGKSFDESKFLCGSLAATIRKLENDFEFPQIWLNFQNSVFHLDTQAIYPVLGLTKAWVYNRISF